ncbi:MAG: hypothetical protein QFC78_06750 [Pseudomonadota bacterium]|nr:hypothetical protein [Pseudomonadota bacterium]
MHRNLLLALTLPPMLAACGSGGVKSVASAPPPKPQLVAVRAPVHAPPARPRVLAAPGLEGVIGASPDELTRRFGPARLDVWEGDARKLQFTGTACVLDVYLYPPAPGAPPEATYVDARRASDGQDVDRTSCVAALKRP